MSTERTYVFGGDGGNGGSKFDITALLPMLGGNNRGVDPGLLALLNQGRNNQDAWGGGCWFIWIILMWFIWGNNGFFGFGGNRGGCNGLPAMLNGDAGRELLMQAIQGNGTAISQLASSLNCSTQQVQTALCNIQNAIGQVSNQVGLTGTQVVNAVQSGDNNIITQLSSCCCNVLQAIERQGSATQLQNCQNVNALTNVMNNNTLALRDGAKANTNAILAKLDAIENQAMQDKIAQLTAQNTALQSEISQRNQNATILNAVGQQIAPLAAGLQALQGDVDGIKCKLPNTVSVPYPQLQVYNPEVARAAAFGAAAGGYAGYGGVYNAGFWG